jgi:tetratricopeptide (TPR) repeat protein
LSERSRSTGIWPRPHAYIGLAKNFVGCGEETAGHIEDALRLSPRDTAAYLWRSFAGSVKRFLGKNEETVALLRHPIETNRNFALPHFYLAVALAELGRLDEARLEAREGLSIDPTFTIRRYRADVPTDNLIFLSRRQQIYEIMRRIGARKDSQLARGAMKARRRVRVLAHLLPVTWAPHRSV